MPAVLIARRRASCSRRKPSILNSFRWPFHAPLEPPGCPTGRAGPRGPPRRWDDAEGAPQRATFPRPVAASGHRPAPLVLPVSPQHPVPDVGSVEAPTGAHEGRPAVRWAGYVPRHAAIAAALHLPRARASALRRRRPRRPRWQRRDAGSAQLVAPELCTAARPLRPQSSRVVAGGAAIAADEQRAPFLTSAHYRNARDAPTVKVPPLPGRLVAPRRIMSC